MRAGIIAFLRRRLPREGRILFALLAAVLGVWFFLWLTSQVTAGRTQAFDEKILLVFRRPDDLAVPIGPPWVRSTAIEITSLGSGVVLFTIIAIVAGYLALLRRYSMVSVVLVATFGGMAISSVLKDFFARVRPSVVPHLAEVSSASFPSGHSMISAVVYLTLGALLARTTTDWRLRSYFLAVAALLTFVIGLSRIYLGVHYPTDVVAGWCAGLFWALTCDLTAQRLQRRGVVQSPAVAPLRTPDSHAA